MNKVVKAVHELVTQGKMPAKSVAIAIGKPYSTLLNVMVRELGYRLAPVD